MSPRRDLVLISYRKVVGKCQTLSDTWLGVGRLDGRREAGPSQKKKKKTQVVNDWVPKKVRFSVEL